MSKAWSRIIVACAALVFVACAATAHAKESVSVGKPAKESVETKPAQKTEAARESKVAAPQQKKYYPEGSPTRAIQDLDDMLDDFIVKEKGEKLTPSEDAHNRELKMKIIHGTFDIRELARLSLANHWGSRTEAEHSQFVGLLTDLLEEKALFSKEQSAAKSKSGGKYFVVYGGHKFDDAAKSRAFVKTKVVVPSENIDVGINYRLKRGAADWKIYDVIVDEASLVDNYKYQFDSIIKKHGYGDLVQRMQNKLNEIRSKRNK